MRNRTAKSQRPLFILCSLAQPRTHDFGSGTAIGHYNEGRAVSCRHAQARFSRLKIRRDESGHIYRRTGRTSTPRDRSECG